MAYLVTGGMGYIGSRIVRDLMNSGKEVVCLDSAGITPLATEVISKEGLEKVKIITGDVSNTVPFFRVIREHGIDLIIHTAYIMTRRSNLEPEYALRVNCMGMINVLEAVRLFGLKRVVWTSAMAAVGRVRDLYREPIGDDDAIYMPDSMYGATKALNEYMVKLYFEKSGVDSIALRLPRVIGVPFDISQPQGVVGKFSEFSRKAALNIPVTIKGPDFVTSYIYVDDVADAHVKACDVPTTKTRVFNACEGEYSNQQLVDTIRKVNPETQVRLEEGISSLTRPVDHRVPTMDTTGIRTELGWQPKHSLEEALRKIFNYFRQQARMALL